MGGQVTNSATPMPIAPPEGGNKGPASPLGNTLAPTVASSGGGQYSQMFSATSPLSSVSPTSSSIPQNFTTTAQDIANAPVAAPLASVPYESAGGYDSGSSSASDGGLDGTVGSGNNGGDDGAGDGGGGGGSGGK